MYHVKVLRETIDLETGCEVIETIGMSRDTKETAIALLKNMMSYPEYREGYITDETGNTIITMRRRGLWVS